MTQDDESEIYVARASLSLVRSATLLGCELHEAEDLAQTTSIRHPMFGELSREKSDLAINEDDRLLLRCHPDR